MKHSLRATLGLIAGLALASLPILEGCTSAAQAQFKTVASGIGSKALAAAETAVISAAISSADKTNKQDFLALVAANLKASAPSILTAADVQQAVAAVTPEKSHWTDLAAQLAQVYATAAPQTDAQKKAILQAIADGLNQAAGPEAKPAVAATVKAGLSMADWSRRCTVLNPCPGP